MGLLTLLFGQESRREAKPRTSGAEHDDLVRFYDAYGRELAMTREEWRDNVFLPNVERIKDNPDELYHWLAGSLDDGFAAEVVPYARHLHRIDPIPERGAVLLAVVYLKLNRLDDAEAVLEEHIGRYGETGCSLTNLAKVYSARGDEKRARSTLWRGLTLDPNQDNGFDWFVALAEESGGEDACCEAIARIAEIPGSWRARVWLARFALESRDLDAALRLYGEAFDAASHPVPADMLMQISGDLGNHGHLVELLKIATPHFDAATHGVLVGNNLIKANVDVGRLDHAQALLEKLYALERPDFQETLSFWDSEIAKARIAAKEPQRSPEIVMLSVPGPIWLPPSSPAEELFPHKRSDAVVVCFLGASANTGAGGKSELQMADVPGRISRGLPLFLCEQFHLCTDGVGEMLQPLICGHGGGLVVSGTPWDDDAVAHHSRRVDPAADYAIAVHIDARTSPYMASMRLVRTIDGSTLDRATGKIAPERLEQGFADLARKMLAFVGRHAYATCVAPPDAYELPRGEWFDSYVLRLEQALAIAACDSDHGRDGFLHGTREILSGNLDLCLAHPRNVTTRLLLARTFGQMMHVRPHVAKEFADKIRRLQSEYPLAAPAMLVVKSIIDRVSAGVDQD